MGPTRRTWARLVVVAAMLAVAVGLVPGPALAAPEDDLEAAQARAHQAAEDLAEAEADLARAGDAVAHVQGRVGALDTRVGLARQQVSALAIRLYVEGTVPIVRILRMGDANDVILAQQYSHVVAGGSTDALRQFRDDREDLERERESLEVEQESQAASLEELNERRAEAVEEIDRLSAVVARAAAAQEAERQAELAAAAPTPTSPALSSAGRSTSGSLPAPDPDTTAAPETSTPSAPTDDGPAPDWVCPVQGPLAFSNDYGAPRGGGYSHQGNDILAPRGTPVVASVDGEVRHRSGAVSGLAYYLDGDDGNEYFGAHLDTYGASGRVSAGTVVGTVGNTGDASSTAPHLHFEIHPGGSGNINPFSKLSQYC